MSELWRWTVSETPDIITGPVGKLIMNPKTGGMPAQAKTFVKQATTATGGGMVISEGADVAQTISLEGTITTEAHFRQLQAWFDDRVQLLVTTHLPGIAWWTYMQSFSPKPKNRSNAPWAMDYTIELLIVSIGPYNGGMEL